MTNPLSQTTITPDRPLQFHKQGYVLLQNALPKMLLAVAYDYLRLKAQLNIGPILGDILVPKTFRMYGDPLMESLLTVICPIVEEATGKRLHPTYAYCRLYQQGDVLPPHKDRLSCEVSVTLCLGHDIAELQKHQPDYAWPIFLNGTSIACRPGDMIIYKGCEVEHWREAFEGTQHGQVFLHYVDQNESYADWLKFDTRPTLGLPNTSRDPKKLHFARLVKKRKYPEK